MFKAATVNLKGNFSRDMGRRLGKGLVEKLGEFPAACWLFCSSHGDLQDLLKGISSAVGTRTLVGCTTDGEISCEGFSTGSAVLGGIVTDQIEFQVAHIPNLSRDSEVAGQELARALSGASYVQLFSDGITGNGCALLRGMAAVLGPQIPISGGTAGDCGEFVRTHQFVGDRVVTDTAVAIGFAGDFRVGTGVRSGWSPIGIAKKVTRASGNVLYELGGQPALEVYERFLGKHAERLPTVGVEYPLGLVDEAGDCDGRGDYYLLRATMSVNRQEGSITFAGEIPEGAMVKMTCGDTNAILEAAGQATELALDDLGDRTPAMVFFYSCMARKIVLDRRTKEEIERVRQKVGREIPILGFYTYGEYCRVRSGGPCFLHNETATVSLLGI